MVLICKFTNDFNVEWLAMNGGITLEEMDENDGQISLFALVST
jgi:hypothetical protein